jgi:hypothetical protein
MATPTKFNSFTEALAEKVHDLGTDTLKVALSNTAPSASNTQLTDITEISAGNGYSAGGFAITASSSAQSGGTYSLVLNSATLTASGGAIGPFRYVVLYNDTATNDELVCWFDRGVELTLADTESYTIDSATWLQIS